MAAGDLVQKGTSVVVGFNGVTFGTWIMQSAGEEPMADIKEIKGPQAATVTKLVTNPRKQYSVSGVILAADLTTARAALIGGTVSINSVSCMIVSLKLSFEAQDAKCDMVAVKEDSMTYSP